MSVPSKTPAHDAAAPADAKTSGLDAFAPEAGTAEAAPAPGAPAGRATIVARLLAVLVLIQAVPTVLWISDHVKPVAAAAPAAAPPPPVVTAACEPADPAPAPPVAAPAEAEPERAAPPRPAGLLAGVVTIDSPIAMNIYSGDKLVGTTAADSLMLPLGTADLEFVNDEVGYRTRRSVAVQAGRTTAVRIDVPRAPLHVNALPWAEVWVDGQRIGETPLGNLQQPLGRREVLFRHPELGERRATVLVTMKEPARISVDLRKK